VIDAGCNNEHLWLWVPAFAGTTLSGFDTEQKRKTPERDDPAPALRYHADDYAAL
jgi:hypothetical protein